MRTVFLSYRRETAHGEARALFKDLVARLGKRSVFMDVDSIGLGRDFRSEIQKTLESCDHMLIVIDRSWAEAKDEEGSLRLNHPDDFVRMEVEAALKRGTAVPVLVGGARMPTPDQLPAEIRALAYRNGFQLNHGTWDADVREMIRRLGLGSKQRRVILALGLALILAAASLLLLLNSGWNLTFPLQRSGELPPLQQ
jgi:TIR domain